MPKLKKEDQAVAAAMIAGAAAIIVAFSQKTYTPAQAVGMARTIWEESVATAKLIEDPRDVH